VEIADRRMYLAKEAGRNRCVRSASGEAVVIYGTGPSGAIAASA
jgi:hypothetical protein